MHELPVMEKILRIILKHARTNGVTKVLSITIETGALSDMEPEWMNYYFSKISRNSEAEGACLKISRTPRRLKCNLCQALHPYADPKTHICPECGGCDWQLSADSHYTIKDMEVL